jgi:activator of HSP90 ATPase
MNIDEPLKETTTDQTKEEKVEEEVLVLIQFTDLDDAQYCQHFSSKFKTINIDKTSPIIQIGQRFYTGEYTNNIGTYLFFSEEDKQQQESAAAATTTTTTESSSSDHHRNDTVTTTEQKIKNNNNNKTNSTYFGKTFKKLTLNRLFIEEKPIVD